MTARPPDAAPEHPGGCGLQGCLYAAIALFSVLLLAMLYLVLSRVGAQP